LKCLEWHHDFIVFDVIADQHQNFLAHCLLLSDKLLEDVVQRRENVWAEFSRIR
jgi:hypothetical protein